MLTSVIANVKSVGVAVYCHYMRFRLKQVHLTFLNHYSTVEKNVYF